MTPRLRNAILAAIRENTVGTVSPSIRRIAKIIGSATTPTFKALVQMREDGLIKAFAGITTLEEVLRVTAPDEDLT